MKTLLSSTDGLQEAQPGAAAPGHKLEIPMRLFRSTIRRIQEAMAGLAPGEVVQVMTNDP